VTEVALPTYKPKDFVSDQEVRWCPGCGDYAVLKAVQMTLPKLNKRREDFVFVSGIGCAARFPYYMDTFGMHSIHGRAPAFATGVKLANPQLEVWLVSGDGDLLSIGGNHTMHILRRNVDVNIVLLNNRIYGLTKGQYSPTSECGKKTKSSPMGSLDYPLNPLSLAIGVGGTFIARTIDIDVKGQSEIMQQASVHKGTTFTEVYQDCNIFNHQTWFYASQKATRADMTIVLKHGEPMIFGADRDKGLRMNGHRIEVINFNGKFTEKDAHIHDETDRGLAFLLAELGHPEFPEPMGVLYRDSTRKPYDQLVHEQVDEAIATQGAGDLNDLLNDGETWIVE